MCRLLGLNLGPVVPTSRNAGMTITGRGREIIGTSTEVAETMIGGRTACPKLLGTRNRLRSRILSESTPRSKEDTRIIITDILRRQLPKIVAPQQRAPTPRCPRDRPRVQSWLRAHSLPILATARWLVIRRRLPRLSRPVGLMLSIPPGLGLLSETLEAAVERNLGVPNAAISGIITTGRMLLMEATQ